MPDISEGHIHEIETDGVVHFNRPVAQWSDKYATLYTLPNDNTETLARIEQKLDRLLDLLDKDKGLWLAPGQDDIVGRYIKDGE